MVQSGITYPREGEVPAEPPGPFSFQLAAQLRMSVALPFLTQLVDSVSPVPLPPCPMVPVEPLLRSTDNIIHLVRD